MIEPMSVCELDAGSPNHHVPRFHRIAAISSAKTMAKPAFDPTCRINSTGSSETTAKATAPDERITPIRFHMPDQITATGGSSECVYMKVETAFAVSWMPLTNSNPRAMSSATPSNTYGQTVG